MGIFSRIFQRGQDGGPTDGRQEEQDSEGREGPAGGAPEEPEIETQIEPEPEPVHVAAPAPALATAAAGSTPAAPLFQTPLWSWPQRSPDTNARREAPAAEEAPPAPVPVAARQESPMAKPEDPAPPAAPAASKPRAPLPGLPRRTPPAGVTATPAAPAPAATPAAVTAPAPQPAAPAPATSRSDATVVMSPPPPSPAPQRSTPAPRATPAPRQPTGAPTPLATAPAPQAVAPAPAPAPQATAPAPQATAPAPAPAPQAAAPAPAPQPAAASPQPAPPVVPAEPPPAAPPRRGHPDTLDEVVLGLQSRSSSSPPPGASSVSTAEDLAAVRGVFHEVAVSHVAHVRDVMLELRYGEADPRWIEMTKPALRSLRAMAAQMELADLCDALDAFCTAVDASVANRARLTGDDKDELLRRYARLIELIPQAFELDAERDRREPIIVEALLYQVPGVEQPTIEKLFAVGLSRLDALMNAQAPEVAAVTGLRPELAAAIVEQFRSYRATATAAVSAPDPATELRRLGELLIMLSLQNDDFTRASSEWSEEAQQRKRQLRKQREQTFQQIKVALARLGERDQLQRLEKLPYQERIATLDKYLSAHPTVRPST